MKSELLLLLILTFSLNAQHYERMSNISSQIKFEELGADELFAFDLVYGAPDRSGIQHPIYRIETFEGRLFRVIENESGGILNSYNDNAEIIYSRFGKYWASNYPESPDYNIILEAGHFGPLEIHQSDIFEEGEILEICELSDQYLTVYSENQIRGYSINGTLLWSYQYPSSDLSEVDVFLTSDESILILDAPDLRSISIDMKSGKEIWKYEGEYSVSVFPFQLSSQVILFDHFYNTAKILSEEGKTLFELEKSSNLCGYPYLFDGRIVNGNIVIPRLRNSEQRLILPGSLTSFSSPQPITPMEWSTQGKYSARVFTFAEQVGSLDSTVQKYRIDIQSYDGREMGYFFPQLKRELDQSTITAQISNDGHKVLLIGRQKDGILFIRREYRISL